MDDSVVNCWSRCTTLDQSSSLPGSRLVYVTSGKARATFAARRWAAGDTGNPCGVCLSRASAGPTHRPSRGIDPSIRTDLAPYRLRGLRRYAVGSTGFDPTLFVV